MHRGQRRSTPLPILHLAHDLRSRSVRDRTGLHFVEGFRAVLEALDAAVPVDTLIYSEVLCQSPGAQKRVRLAKRQGIRVARVTPEEFRRISMTPRASGLGAILHQHWMALEQINPRRGLCWIALGRVRSSGNLGTILRTAEAVNAGGAVFLGDASDPFDPTAVRASMGGLYRLQIARASFHELGQWSRRHGCRVIGTSPSGSMLYTDVPIDVPLLIFFGEERQGMTSQETALCTHTARIPIAGRADSLNVGVAAGVMLYEVLRRSRNRSQIGS